MKINSGAKKGYYFLWVKDSLRKILENVKTAFPANPRKKFKFFKRGDSGVRERALDLKDLF